MSMCICCNVNLLNKINGVYSLINPLNQKPETTWTIFCAATSQNSVELTILKLNDRVRIIRNDFIIVDFMDVLTPANHSQT